MPTAVKPGTMLISIRFPTTWPTPAPHVLLDRNEHGTRVRLVIDQAGQPQLLLEADGAPTIHRFQKIQPMGAGYGTLAIAWGEGPPALYVNGLQVKPIEDAGDTVLEVPLKLQPHAVSEAIPFSDAMLARMSGEERLFLHSLQDMEQKLASGTEYELLQVAGILRKLLLEEGDPLVHQVNRLYKAPIRFDVLARREPLPKEAGEPELDFMALLPDGAAAIEVTEQQLWKHIVLEHKELRFNAREVVQAAAHVLGGIHRRKPGNEAEKRIVYLEEAFQAMRTPLPLYAVRDVGMVVAAGLSPLARAIAAKYRGQRT